MHRNSKQPEYEFKGYIYSTEIMDSGSREEPCKILHKILLKDEPNVGQVGWIEHTPYAFCTRKEFEEYVTELFINERVPAQRYCMSGDSFDGP